MKNLTMRHQYTDSVTFGNEACMYEIFKLSEIIDLASVIHEIKNSIAKVLNL